MAQAPKAKDPIRALADELRGRHGIENRAGVQGSERVEYFRGKDFAAFFRKHPDKIMQGILRSGWKEEDGIREMLLLLARRGLVTRSERVYKKPKPGKKRLTKWPRKLQAAPAAEQNKFSEDGFYAWMYDLPTSPWLLIGSIGVAAGVVLLCLFPLAPYKLKIGVVYASLGLVGALLGLVLLRWVVAGASWAVAGRAIWFLPNMLSETVGLDEAFWPLWELEEVDGDWSWWRSHAWQRAVFAGTVATVVWGLQRVAPGTGELTSGAKATHDQLLEWLNLQDAQFGRLGAAGGNGTSAGGDAMAAAAPPPARKPVTEERSAAAAVAAARAAAAQPAHPPEPEVIPSFDDLVDEEAAEAAAEAEAGARAAGGSEEEVQQAREAAAAAVKARAAAAEQPAAAAADEL